MDVKFLIRFLVVWAANSLVLYLAHLYNPINIVLGTASLSAQTAAVVSGFLLTVLCRIAKRVILRFKIPGLKGRYSMFAYYFVINSVAIWLIARMAPITGLGIRAFYWAFVLGFATSLVQWVLRQVFKVFKLLPSR